MAYRNKANRIGVLSLLVLLGATLGFAQLTTANLTGLVADPGGAVIPGASVVLTNSDTGEERQQSSGPEGRFTLSQLKPGTYELSVSTVGFKTFVRSGIRLQANQDAEFNTVLELGEVTETVEVTAAAVVLDTQSANQSNTLNTEEITELPINFRNPLALVHANAGVVSMFARSGRTQLQDRVSDQDYGLFSMNGGREASNTVNVDGVTNKGGDWGATFGTPSVDAVQEMQIARNTYDAEYGKVANGVVSLVTKGGGDQFHGSLFWFHRNDNLDANQWERNRAGNPKPEFKRNQVGLNASGPMWKRQGIYALFGYEAMRLPSARTTVQTMPPALERTGDFTQSFNGNGSLQEIYDPFTTRANPDGAGFIRDRFAGNVIPASRFDPVAVNVLKLFPNPTRDGVGVTNVNNFFKTVPFRQEVDRYDTRVDWSKHQKYSTFVRWSRSDLLNNSPRFFDNGADTGFENGQPFYNVSWSNTIVPSPTWVINVNAGSGGGHRFANPIPNVDGTSLTDLGYAQSYADQFQNQNLGQYALREYATIGRARLFQNIRRTHTGGVNISNERGNHSLKLGFNFEAIQWNFIDSRTPEFSFSRGPTTGPLAVGNSGVVGNSVASLLLGVGGGSVRFSGDPAFTQKYAAWYAQDTWRVTPDLTLTLGLRHERQLPRTERYERQAYFDFSIANPLGDTAGYPVKGGLKFTGQNDRGITALDTNDWAPRVGLSYKFTDKLVMRGGYGISYSQTYIESGVSGMNGFDLRSTWETNPDGVVPVNLLSNPWPNGPDRPTGTDLGLLTAVGANVNAWPRNHPTPYVQSFSVDFQYELFPGSVFEIGYSGNRGRKFAWGSNRNFNQVRMESLSQGEELNNRIHNPFFGLISSGPMSGRTAPLHRFLRSYPHFNNVNVARSSKGAVSNFDALYVKFTRRFADGLTVLSSYQWARAEDNASEDQGWFVSDAFRDVFDAASDYSVSAHDLPHDFVTNLVWELPVGKGKALGGGMGGALDAVVGGWKVAGTIRFSIGVPINIRAPNTLGAFGFGVKRTDVVGNPKLSSPTPERWFNTDAFVAPGRFEQGTAPRYMNDLRQDGIANADVSLSKSFQVHERMSAQLRAEFFNFTNSPVFGVPIGGGPVTVTNGAFGRVVRTIGSPRQVQMALKLLF